MPHHRYFATRGLSLSLAVIGESFFPTFPLSTMDGQLQWRAGAEEGPSPVSGRHGEYFYIVFYGKLR
jgi:hypothetical protein